MLLDDYSSENATTTIQKYIIHPKDGGRIDEVDGKWTARNNTSGKERESVASGAVIAGGNPQ